MPFPTPSFALFLAIAWPFFMIGSRLGVSLPFMMISSGLLFLASSSWFSAICAGAVAWTASRFAQQAPSLSSRAFAIRLFLLLAPLLYFKYSSFFLGFWGASESPLAWRQAAPAGISFYTFGACAWILAARHRSLPEAPAGAGMATLLFFPISLSGPICRPSDLWAQTRPRSLPSNFPEASSLFAAGFFLKLVVASRLAQLADPIFARMAEARALDTLWAAHLYSGQLYADFAGYSLMAMGVARFLGFHIPANFAAPYLSTNLADFWRRWHISLSSFWRDHIYIPLGGNRVTPPRQAINLMAVMLLCGLWHGAGWSFLLWGALHGLGLVAHRFIGARLKLSPWVSMAITFETVTLFWLPFRLTDFDQLLLALRSLALWGDPILVHGLWLGSLSLAAMLVEQRWGATLMRSFDRLARRHPWTHLILLALFMILCVELAPDGIPNFIYFSF